MKARVFLIEEVAWLELQGAERFGDIEVIFDRKARRPSMFSKEFQVRLLNTLEEKGYRPGFDSILVAGKIALCSLLTSVCAAEHGVVKLVLFCATDRSYVEVKVGG